MSDVILKALKKRAKKGELEVRSFEKEYLQEPVEKKTIELEVYSANGGIGLTLTRSIGDNGEGYRVFGPKLYGQGRPLVKYYMSVDDIDRLIQELKFSKQFLKPKKTRKK